MSVANGENATGAVVSDAEKTAEAGAGGTGDTSRSADAGGEAKKTEDGTAVADTDSSASGQLGELKAKLEDAEKTANTLRRELENAVGRRKSASGKAETAEQQLAAERAAHEATRREVRTRDTVAAVLAKVPAGHHKHARDTVIALASRGMDLGAEDTKATATAVEARLKAEYPEYFVESEGRLPRIRQATTGVKREAIGGVVNSDGDRIL